MSCRSRRASSVLAAVAATFLGGLLMAAPAGAAPAAPHAVTQAPDDFVWPTPPHPQLPDFPCVRPLPGLPCITEIPDDFVWPVAPRN
ncbi:hypothetical protein DEJ45_10785 [Streptomyces venezuelae]|uniref:hypothetical protein n=1 Tax=Streptomyces venezuelae TaxID=54571 RepID=UPI00123CF610|nr:hypothetical protein [Streptomyces venezuelae]QES12838.1 hypothetical protein DEJ45_10785 [Streptomyces venezuelae]